MKSKISKKTSISNIPLDSHLCSTQLSEEIENHSSILNLKNKLFTQSSKQEREKRRFWGGASIYVHTDINIASQLGWHMDCRRHWEGVPNYSDVTGLGRPLQKLGDSRFQMLQWYNNDKEKNHHTSKHNNNDTGSIFSKFLWCPRTYFIFVNIPRIFSCNSYGNAMGYFMFFFEQYMIIYGGNEKHEICHKII